MPLEELTINGFKSFADKTTIKFNSGITGIVGPNGSGKSNITEAIRWVMGEGSAKSLRGESMKDVIFAGSQFRAPLNRAEVTLVFNNEDHQLNKKSSKISVTRRILRSGDSDYLINNQAVRLKDVRSLFIDSGISVDSLAIISQGKVDQILNSRPEDRRNIFEEAAGVSHFKQQKDVAIAQLAKTNDNLIRINDLVKELENQVEPLHAKSSLAKQYIFEKKRLDEKLKVLLALQIENLDKNKKDFEQKVKQNLKILAQLDKEVKQSKDQLELKKSTSTNLNEKKDQKQRELLQLTKKLADLNTNLQINKQTAEYNRATAKEYIAQKTDLIQEKDKQKTQLLNLSDDCKKLELKLEDLEKKSYSLKASLKDDPVELNQKLESIRSQYIDLLQMQTSVNNKINYLDLEIKRNVNSELSHNNGLDKDINMTKNSLVKLKKQGDSLLKSKKVEEENLKKLKVIFEKQASAKTNLEREEKQIQTNLASSIAQVDGLKRLQNRHEGYYFGVKYVLEHITDFQGVLGVIGELITFPANLEAAISTALGAGVQNIVTVDKQSAKLAIYELKQTKRGRATFLPLDGLRKNNVNSSTIALLRQIKGFIGVANELVNVKENYDITNAIDYLLGNVLIVDNMDTALIVQQKIGRYYRIVTLDGDIISPGGSMTGGAKNRKNNSPLQTNVEITLLEEKIKELKNSFNTNKLKYKQIQDQYTKSNNEYQNCQVKIRDISQELGEQAIRYQSQEKDLTRLLETQKIQKKKSSDKNIELENLKNEFQEQKEQKLKIAKNAQDAKEKIEQVKFALTNYDQASRELQSSLSTINSQIAVYNNKIENNKLQQQQENKLIKNTVNQINLLEKKINQLAESDSQDFNNPEQIKYQISELNKKKDTLTSELQSFNQKLGKLDAQINKLDSTADRNYDLRKNAAKEQEGYSVKVAEFTTRINQKLEILSHDYSLTFEAAIKLIKVKNTIDLRDKLQREVKLHQMSLDDIGSVDLESIKEYDAIKTRYDFLNGQQSDLLQARDDIQSSMSKLDNEVCTRFEDTFNHAENSFEKIFPIMFGGGHAKLQLTQPDNLLETGIEIIAQPPGKKLQKLRLLSGGERALTAITLLFAMLEVHPMPFSILDEVEAALDEANVTRFADFLNRYDLKTQFIVITHRRGTMRKADYLYGVVMQESGVSQVLSVSLKEIKEEVK